VRNWELALEKLGLALGEPWEIPQAGTGGAYWRRLLGLASVTRWEMSSGLHLEIHLSWHSETLGDALGLTLGEKHFRGTTRRELETYLGSIGAGEALRR
jgi:hypothetical protein